MITIEIGGKLMIALIVCVFIVCGTILSKKK